METREERKRRKRKEKEELLAYKIEQGIAMWMPADNPKATLDPYKTLFVARVSYETSESKLRREFERYGPVNKVSSFSIRWEFSSEEFFNFERTLNSSRQLYLCVLISCLGVSRPRQRGETTWIRVRRVRPQIGYVK